MPHTTLGADDAVKLAGAFAKSVYVKIGQLASYERGG
jgi:hypothetical protein